MKVNPFRSSKLLALCVLLLVVALGTGTAAASQVAQPDLQTGSPQNQTTSTPSSNVSVYATGLNNPRGLKFGPDGDLYVAEGGTGGTDSTEGQCEQVVAPVGPYTGSPDGARISKISADGTRTTVAENLPSSQTSPALGNEVSGVADVAFIGNTLYAVLAGAGCSHGVSGIPNAVIRVNDDKSWTQVADLSAFQMANPVKNPQPGDFEPDGTWYSLLATGGALYAIEPNHGELDKITPDGNISRIIDISDSQGHVVPTAMAMGSDGNFYVGDLTGFPAQAGIAKIFKITPDGQISVFAEGLTTVLGVAFDNQGQLYALETSGPATSGGPPVVPGTGRVVRVTAPDKLETIASGLTFPSAMTFGPDGKLYVSNFGFGSPAGQGEVVSISLPATVPTTMPKTGGAQTPGATLWLALIAGAVLVAAGWFLRRKSIATS
jgi:LPXTG-motif cell wall-anchored protein